MRRCRRREALRCENPSDTWRGLGRVPSHSFSSALLPRFVFRYLRTPAKQSDLPCAPVCPAAAAFGDAFFFVLYGIGAKAGGWWGRHAKGSTFLLCPSSLQTVALDLQSWLG